MAASPCIGFLAAAKIASCATRSSKRDEAPSGLSGVPKKPAAGDQRQVEGRQQSGWSTTDSRYRVHDAAGRADEAGGVVVAVVAHHLHVARVVRVAGDDHAIAAV